MAYLAILGLSLVNPVHRMKVKHHSPDKSKWWIRTIQTKEKNLCDPSLCCKQVCGCEKIQGICRTINSVDVRISRDSGAIHLVPERYGKQSLTNSHAFFSSFLLCRFTVRYWMPQILHPGWTSEDKMLSLWAETFIMDMSGY